MSEKVNDSGVVELIGKIMVVAIIVLFLVVAFVFFLHLYAKWFWYRREDLLDGPHRRRRRRSDFAGGHEELTPAAILRRGLDDAALKSIPVVQFDPKDFKDGLECAVCLSELNEGEKTRILPKCNHGFHVECIDMWFQSHSTCPICRDQSGASTEVSLENLLETPAQIPTNVLFWGNEVRVNSGDPQLEDGLYPSQGPAASLEDDQPAASSSSLETGNGPDGVLVIDIPRQINEDEDLKSPITSRMMSFKRLFGRDKQVNPSSPSCEDVEQRGSRSQDQHY